MKHFKITIAVYFLIQLSGIISAQAQESTSNGFQRIFCKGKKYQTESTQNNLYKPGKSLNYFWNVFDWQPTGYSLMTYTPTGKLSVKIDSGFMQRKTIYTYDGLERETERLEQNFNSANSLWENDRRDVHIFDSQGAIQEIRSEQWVGTSWSPISGEKHIRNYNAQNLILEDLQKNWNMQDSVWENDYMETAFLYDAQLRLQSYVAMNWVDSVWENEEKSLWQYGPDNKPNEVILQDWNGTAFVDSTRITDILWNYWNGNLSQSDPSQYTMQKLVGGNWTNSMRFTITRDLNGSVTYLNEMYFNGNWVPFNRMSSLFDDQQNPVVYINQNYNPAAQSFDTAFCTSFQNTYDDQGRILEQVVHYWDQDIHLLEPVSKQEFSQHSMFTSAYSKLELSRFKAVPNPVSAGGRLSISGAHGMFRIMDISGKVQASGQVESDGNIYVKSLLPGFYLIDFAADGGEKVVIRLSVY